MHAVGHGLTERSLGEGDIAVDVIDMVRADREVVSPGARMGSYHLPDSLTVQGKAAIMEWKMIEKTD